MNFEDLRNPELQEKLKSAKSVEELLALAKEQGVELSDEQLEAVSGGWGDVVILPPEYGDYFAGMPLPR